MELQARVGHDMQQADCKRQDDQHSITAPQTRVFSAQFFLPVIFSSDFIFHIVRKAKDF